MFRQKQKIQHSILLRCISTAILKKTACWQWLHITCKCRETSSAVQGLVQQSTADVYVTGGGVVSRFEEKDLTQWELE